MRKVANFREKFTICHAWDMVHICEAGTVHGIRVQCPELNAAGFSSMDGSCRHRDLQM